MGDALKPVDPDNFDAGFDFDGRTGEISSSPAEPGSALPVARALRCRLCALGA
jgi:hypothetical protein